MRVLAPAKINLHLRVGAVREDGFHPLMSWMVTVGLFDILTIDRRPVEETAREPTPAGVGPAVQLSCSDPSLDCGEKNLIVRAGHGLWRTLQNDEHRSPQSDSVAHGLIRDAGLQVHLEKSIPVGGGLGGGSSDAARMLLALARLWQLDGSATPFSAPLMKNLAAVAQTLGSDVPFFLFGPSSICQGRGEIVQPFAAPRLGWALLILPQGISMPTGLVYQRFDALALGKAQARLDPPWPAESDVSRATVKLTGQEWTSLTSDALLPRLVNDLEEPAFEIAPQLGRLRSAMEKILGRIVRMSGSGSTLFTLYDEEREARKAARLVTNRDVRAMAVQIAPPIHDDLENE